jgi:iron(III) transport system substrate-binding protein
MTTTDDRTKSGATRRRFLAGASAIGATSLLVPGLLSRAAWAAMDEAALVAAAKKEGAATIYSNADPAALLRALKGFKAKYGFDPDVQRLTGAALAQRFTAEYESGVHLADMFISSDPVFPKDAIKKGWLLRPDDLPNTQTWPKDDTKDGLVSLGLNPYTLTWNTALVPNGLKDWKEMNDPKWRGKVLAGDPRVLASARLWYVAIRRKYGDDFLKELGSHATFSPSAVPGLQQLAAGAVAIYAPSTYLNVTGLIEKGAPIKFALIDPVVVSVPWAAVVAKAPHPNAGRLVLNYIMSMEGQQAYNEDGFSVLPNVPKTKTVPGGTADIDPNDGEKQLPELLSLLKLA